MYPWMIGPYRVVGKLGQGGMGLVVEAIRDDIKRRVAIKVLELRLSEDPAMVERFLNEARAVNLISHPAIVQISDHGQLPDGRLYLVMELLRGVTLSDRLKQRGERLPEAEVLRHGWTLVGALCAAHEQDIVHRDIKPSNLMLVPDVDMPGGERLKVLDFGIARLGAQHLKSAQPLTLPGHRLGTPVYMAPEQCLGSFMIDGKADVYAVGVLFYRMLAGRLPLEAADTVKQLAMHLAAAPPPLLGLAPNVSRPFAALIHQMLAKDPRQRPSMQEVKSALYPLGAAEPPLPARLIQTVPLSLLTLAAMGQPMMVAPRPNPPAATADSPTPKGRKPAPIPSPAASAPTVYLPAKTVLNTVPLIKPVMQQLQPATYRYPRPLLILIGSLLLLILLLGWVLSSQSNGLPQPSPSQPIPRPTMVPLHAQ